MAGVIVRDRGLGGAAAQRGDGARWSREATPKEQAVPPVRGDFLCVASGAQVVVRRRIAVGAMVRSLAN